jgi:hypothetical protein
VGMEEVDYLPMAGQVGYTPGVVHSSNFGFGFRACGVVDRINYWTVSASRVEREIDSIGKLPLSSLSHLLPVSIPILGRCSGILQGYGGNTQQPCGLQRACCLGRVNVDEHQTKPAFT